jgi:hypothetical protein
LIDERLLNAALVSMLTTAILGPVLTERFAPRMLRDEAPADRPVNSTENWTISGFDAPAVLRRSEERKAIRALRVTVLVLCYAVVPDRADSN